ncbi:MAG: hypothetical protein ACLP9L_41445 [Thermoguttaceae bacterium]
MSCNREWLSLSEAGRRLGASPQTVHRLAQRRLLSCRRLPGCQPRVPASEVEELAVEHTSKAARLHVVPPADAEPVRLSEPVSS